LPDFLSFISSVKVATSPSFRGDFETRVIITSFCVIKCSAISLRFVNVSSMFLLIDVCEMSTGTVGVIITGGLTGITGCMGVTTLAGVFGIVGVVIGVVVHVCTIGRIGSAGIVGSTGAITGSGVFVLLL
jgi:hypothetical protein